MKIVRYKMGLRRFAKTITRGEPCSRGIAMLGIGQVPIQGSFTILDATDARIQHEIVFESEAEALYIKEAAASFLERLPSIQTPKGVPGKP